VEYGESLKSGWPFSGRHQPAHIQRNRRTQNFITKSPGLLLTGLLLKVAILSNKSKKNILTHPKKNIQPNLEKSKRTSTNLNEQKVTNKSKRLHKKKNPQKSKIIKTNQTHHKNTSTNPQNNPKNNSKK